MLLTMPNIVVEYMSEEKTNKRPQDFGESCGKRPPCKSQCALVASEVATFS